MWSQPTKTGWLGGLASKNTNPKTCGFPRYDWKTNRQRGSLPKVGTWIDPGGMPTSLGAAAFLQKKKRRDTICGTWHLVPGSWVLVTSEKSKKDFGGVFFVKSKGWEGMKPRPVDLDLSSTFGPEAVFFFFSFRAFCHENSTKHLGSEMWVYGLKWMSPKWSVLLYVTWKGSLNILALCFLPTFFCIFTWGCFKTFASWHFNDPKRLRCGIPPKSLNLGIGIIVTQHFYFDSWRTSWLGSFFSKLYVFHITPRKIWKLKVMFFFLTFFQCFVSRGILKGKPRTLRSFKAAIFQPYPSSLLLLAALQQTQAYGTVDSHGTSSQRMGRSM